jgi:hypothetical protein
MDNEDNQQTRTKQLDTGNFWRIIFPILCLVLLLFILFVIFTMPDWALTCGTGLESVQALAKTLKDKTTAAAAATTAAAAATTTASAAATR